MMDDQKLGYVLHVTRKSVSGDIWSEDSHEINLKWLKRACQHSSKAEDHAFFSAFGGILESTSNRLAPPSSIAFKVQAQQLFDAYAPESGAEATATERQRYGDYLSARKRAADPPEASDPEPVAPEASESEGSAPDEVSPEDSSSEEPEPEELSPD